MSKNNLYLANTIVATIIGAGFASGQEIYSFFNVYGKWSFVGFFVVFLSFVFIFKAVLHECYEHKIDCFSEYMHALRLHRLEPCIEACVALFAFCGFCAMVSATGALLSMIFQVDYLYGAGCMLVLCGLVLLKDIRAIATVNMILAPIICLGLLYFSIYGILFRSIQTFAIAHYHIDVFEILFSAILYASYNILSAVTVLCSMRCYCDSRRSINASCLLAGGILAGLGIVIWVTIEIYNGKIILGEIPMFEIVSRGGKVHMYLYSVLLIASVLTTALGCGYAVLGFMKSRWNTSKKFSVIALALCAIPVCMLGFADIVRSLYSLFGYLGLPICLWIAVRQVKKRRKKPKKLKNMGNELN